jgi:hypothetical protein
MNSSMLIRCTNASEADTRAIREEALPTDTVGDLVVATGLLEGRDVVGLSVGVFVRTR